MEHTVWITTSGIYRDVQQLVMEKFMPGDYEEVNITLDDYSDIIAVSEEIDTEALESDLDLQQLIYEPGNAQTVADISELDLCIYCDTKEYNGDTYKIMYVGE